MCGKRSPDDAVARAKSNGYQRGAFTAKDSHKNLNKHVDKVIQNHDSILRIYVTWWQDNFKADQEYLDRDTVTARVLCQGAPAPSMVDVKDFLRFYLKQSKGRINKHASVESVVSNAEFFYAGFTRVTGTPTAADERSEVFRWIRMVLPDEGDAINERLPKHNFAKRDLDEVLLTLWTRKDLISISETERIEFMFLLHVYCWTGARIDALFKEKGLRYRDIQLVLRRRSTGNGYEFMWKIDQRWVKGNRSPDTVVFGAAGKEHCRLLYNDGALLLPLAFANKSLFGFDSLDDLWQQEIPPGEDELPLRWKDSANDLPIVSLSKSKFLRIFRSTLDNAGYFCAASVHQIRRYLGKKVDERYTEVERSQHILQADPRVFGQSYVAECSAVDGMSAFLNEPADHTVNDYFQGLGRFRERGAPTCLPASMKANLEKDPDIMKLREREATARDDEEREEASKACRSLLTSLGNKALTSFRQAWIRQRRDWKILTRGKVSPEIDTSGNQLNLVMPERDRVTQKMEQKEPLTTLEMREAIQDIYTLCTRDYTVFYRPGEEPLQGLCPVCEEDIERLQPNKRYRSNHIHECRRRQKAKEIHQLPSSLEYCYDCLDWYAKGAAWEKHCQGHLPAAQKNCGTIIYRSTLIKPAFCPECLRADGSAADRMKSWTRDADVLAHMRNVHLNMAFWPSVRLCCNLEWDDEQSFFYHLADAHGLRESKISTKRKAADDDNADQRPKRTAGRKEPYAGYEPAIRLSTPFVDMTSSPTLPLFGDDYEIETTKFGLEENELQPNSLTAYGLDFPGDKIYLSGSVASHCSSLDSAFELRDEELDAFYCPKSASSNTPTFKTPASLSLVDESDEVLSDQCDTIVVDTGKKLKIKFVSKKPKITLRLGKKSDNSRAAKNTLQPSPLSTKRRRI